MEFLTSYFRKVVLILEVANVIETKESECLGPLKMSFVERLFQLFNVSSIRDSIIVVSPSVH